MGTHLHMRWIALALLLVPRFAGADSRLIDDSTFAVRHGGDLTFDGNLLLGMPAALPAGMTTGFSLGLTRNCGCHFSYGVRASWSTETESSLVWTVSQSDYRLRAVGAVRHDAGRGTIALRLGIGTTIVHEDRIDTSSMRLSHQIETRAVEALPAADLQAVVGLHITGPWLATIAAGPSVDVLDGALKGGFVAEMGVAWQP